MQIVRVQQTLILQEYCSLNTAVVKVVPLAHHTQQTAEEHNYSSTTQVGTVYATHSSTTMINTFIQSKLAVQQPAIGRHVVAVRAVVR